MIMSDGELYRMQQDAIERARQTARLSPDYKQEIDSTKKKKGFDFSNLSSDGIIIGVIILTLLSDGCDDNILLIALIVLALGQ